MRTSRSFFVGTLLLGFAGWCIWLGGLAAVSQQCITADLQGVCVCVGERGRGPRPGAAARQGVHAAGRLLLLLLLLPSGGGTRHKGEGGHWALLLEGFLSH